MLGSYRGNYKLIVAFIRKGASASLPPWTVVAWGVIAVMRALVAMLLLLPYEGWIVRRGYQAWTILAWREGQVTSAPWRKLWWWILLSYAALIGGVAGYVFIQQVMQR